MISGKSSNHDAAAFRWCWISAKCNFSNLWCQTLWQTRFYQCLMKHHCDVDSYCVSNWNRVSFLVINRLWPFCTQGNKLHIIWFIFTRGWTRLLCTVPGLFIVCTRTSNQCHFLGFTGIIRQSYHTTSCPWVPLITFRHLLRETRILHNKQTKFRRC